MQIAVGGCLAQKDRDAVLKKAPWVDVVFGTHNIGSLPTLLDRARHNERAQVEIVEALQEFPSTLPAARESAYAAWVSISVGCNNTCTFCIVPALRGKEVDRRPGDILAEVQSLVDQGVARGHPARAERQRLRRVLRRSREIPRDRGAFAVAAARVREIDGLERVRFTSPHPAEFTDDVIEAMAETPNVCPALHMPLQSGSDRVLKAMRRSYRAERYLGIIDKVRAAIPHAAITTDIIVGFPRRDRGRLPGHPRRGRAGPFRQRVHLPVLQAAGHPGGRAGRPAAQSRCGRTLSAAHRAAGTDLAGGEQSADRRRVELLVAAGRGPQGRQHRPDERARPRRPAGALPPRAARHPARRRRHHHRHRRRAAPPDRRRPGRCTIGAPAPATRTPPGREPAPASAWECPASVPRIAAPASTGCAR